jgi:enamine deaminase RidA (YjgF/YER057c/UK114 family)
MKIIKHLNALAVAAATLLVAATAGAQTPASGAPTGTIESRLSAALVELGFADGKLPALKPAFGNYVDAVQVGNTLYLSSAAPQRPDGQFVKGRVPSEVSVEDAQKAAKLACVRQIARLQLVLGDLNKVKRIVFVKGKILATPEFTDHTKITDACSALFVTVFGDAGKHARTTEGIVSAPFGVTVEVETIVELKN